MRSNQQRRVAIEVLLAFERRYPDGTAPRRHRRVRESSPFALKCQPGKPPDKTRPSRRGGRSARASARDSDQPIRPGWRATRMRRINRLTVATEVDENPLDHRRFLDAGNDAQASTAVPAGLNVNSEHPLEALGPGQGPLPGGGRCLARFARSGGTGSGHNLRAVGARGGKHTVVAGQVDAGPRNSGRNRGAYN